MSTKSGKVLGTSFSSAGRSDGQIYFPRCMRCTQNGDALLVLDKTGRIQKFTRDGKFAGVAAKIDDYIGNGFTVRGEEAVIACSGIVLDSVSLINLIINNFDIFTNFSDYFSPNIKL
jgi:hypothetical protein